MANIYCIGRNYVAHARELDNPVPQEPVVFLKSSASIRKTVSGRIAYPEEVFHFEAEVVLVIGKRVRCGAPVGWDCVRGLCLGLDLTRREKQNELKKSGLPWTLAKSFEGAAVLSDEMEISRFVDREKIRFSFFLEGRLKQAGNTADMLFPVPKILETIGRMHSLEPGDLIFTGTPQGVDEIRVGDSFELRWEDLKISYAGRL